MATETADLVVVGAGIHGLVTAKTYLQLFPATKLLLLERAPTLGGVWAAHRIYPGLKSNNLLGTYEFSDFPMRARAAELNVTEGEHIPGEAMHKYLDAYATEFGVKERIRFRSRVESVEMAGESGRAGGGGGEGGGWVLNVVAGEGVRDPLEDEDEIAELETQYTIRTEKLIVATGLMSEPFLPVFPGASSFDAPLFHSSALLSHSDLLSPSSITSTSASTSTKNARRVAVLGGTKSAWDAVYALASSGTPVHWIIRESGHGPVWMSPSHVTPLRIWLEKLITTRALTWFSPCVWATGTGFEGWMRWILHETRVGRVIVRGFWRALEQDVVELNGYDNHKETAKLRPWFSPFWIASGLSILNYPTDFFSLVRSGKVKIHIADITALSAQTIHLSTSTSLPTSALVCATGWQHRPALSFLSPSSPSPSSFSDPSSFSASSLPHFSPVPTPTSSEPSPPTPASLERALGLPYHLPPSSTDPEKPYPSEDADDEDDDGVTALFPAADASILSRYPALRDQPELNARYRPLQGHGSSGWNSPTEAPWRLHRFMLPPKFAESRNILFVGMASTISTTLVAQAQALWAAAYLSGNLDVVGGASSVPSSSSSAGPRFPFPFFSRAPAAPSSAASSASSSDDGNNDDNADNAGNNNGGLLWETALHARFTRWRYPGGHGARFPDFVFDTIPYVDLLLQDLNLHERRKVHALRQRWRRWGGVGVWAAGWVGGVRECVSPYGVGDYQGLVGEWMRGREVE